MLPGLTVPASLAGVLQVLRPSFTAPSFATLTLLVVGMVAQTGPRTVCGMLLGAGLQAVVSHHRLHRFFSVNRWSADALGLVLARLVVERLLPAGAALEVAVDDTLFRRRGKKVHAAFWTHDASQPGRVTARGNRWVIVGIVVRLRFQARPTCLPVLFRLWGGKGSATPVELARTLVGLLARAFPDPTGSFTSSRMRPTTAGRCGICRSASPSPPGCSAMRCCTPWPRHPPAGADVPAPAATGSATPPRSVLVRPGGRPA